LIRIINYKILHQGDTTNMKNKKGV
jgi:hypothetical protein